MSDALQQIVPNVWTLEDGAPATPGTPCAHLAAELARGLGDDGLRVKLLKTFTALGGMQVADLREEVFKDDVLDALKANGMYPSMLNTIRKHVFGPDLAHGDFKSNSLLVVGDDNDVHSEKSSLPKFDTSVVIWHFFRSFERYNELELPNYTKVRIIEALGPINTNSSADAAIGRAVNVLFGFHCVTFKTTYVDTNLKMRYAYILFEFKLSMSLDCLVRKIKTDFSNRRQGRFSNLCFHSAEVENNKAVAQMHQRFPNVVKITTENGARFYDESITEYDTQFLVDMLCVCNARAKKEEPGPSRCCVSALSSDSHTTSSPSSRHSPVPLVPTLDNATPRAVNPSPLAVETPTPLPKFSGAHITKGGLDPKSAFAKAGFSVNAVEPLAPSALGIVDPNVIASKAAGKQPVVPLS